MKAAVLRAPKPIAQNPLALSQVPVPDPPPGHLLLKVRACGICRTDLHIAEGVITSMP